MIHTEPSDVQSETGNSNENSYWDDSYRIDVEDVNGITVEEVIELCKSKAGTVDEITGYEIGYSVWGAFEYEKKQYYLLSVEWLYEGKVVTYRGILAVSAEGDRIYSVFYEYEGKPVFRTLWKKEDESGLEN